MALGSPGSLSPRDQGDVFLTTQKALLGRSQARKGRLDSSERACVRSAGGLEGPTQLGERCAPTRSLPEFSFAIFSFSRHTSQRIVRYNVVLESREKKQVNFTFLSMTQKVRRIFCYFVFSAK